MRNMDPLPFPRRCDFCSSPVIPNGECPSCELYNAAVRAQKAAAMSIAKSINPRATGAYLNEYGVLAWVNGQCVFIAGPKVSAPFVALTAATRLVVFESGLLSEDTRPDRPPIEKEPECTCQ